MKDTPAVAALVNGSDERTDYRPGYEIVAERILEFIAESRLVPGDRMPTENDLAQQLDTSRAVVREAVKILSALGRVRAHKGRGLFVADDDGIGADLGAVSDEDRAQYLHAGADHDAPAQCRMALARVPRRSAPMRLRAAPPRRACSLR